MRWLHELDDTPALRFQPERRLILDVLPTGRCIAASEPYGQGRTGRINLSRMSYDAEVQPRHAEPAAGLNRRVYVPCFIDRAFLRSMRNRQTSTRHRGTWHVCLVVFYF